MKLRFSTFLIRSGVVLFWTILFIGSLEILPLLKWFPHEKTITIFAWGDIFDPVYLAKFEQETGIKIQLNYFSSNEELLVKLRATKGKGYDLIVPSDYAVQTLIGENLLKPLDKTRLSFYHTLNPLLLDLPFDPNNTYSVPYSWEIFGIGIDKDFFDSNDQARGWQLIFKPHKPYNVAMVNDPMEAILFAAHYLFGHIEHLTDEQLDKVKKLLIDQKQWVEAYSNFRADYFLVTKNCPAVIASSSYIWRSIENYPFIDFVIPDEGSFITIESLAIPATSTNEDMVYKFINFLYQPESIAHHVALFSTSPARTDILEQLAFSPQQKKIIQSSPQAFKKYAFIRPLVSEQQKHDLWITIKS